MVIILLGKGQLTEMPSVGPARYPPSLSQSPRTLLDTGLPGDELSHVLDTTFTVAKRMPLLAEFL